MHQTFSTPSPVRLDLEFQAGVAELAATETHETSVSVEGPRSEEFTVTQNGEEIVVRGPKLPKLSFGQREGNRVSITLPTNSHITARTGSADVVVNGTVGGGDLTTGSGDLSVEHLSGPATVKTGSGDISLGLIEDEVRVKSGSGDTAVETADAPLMVSTGSGDITVAAARGPVAAKTGSGDVRIGHAGDDVALSTGSGDLVIEHATGGEVVLKGASSDISIGIPRGLPVWTNLHTLSGSITSDLAPVGEPTEGADHLAITVNTVSGDIRLRQA